MNHNQVKGSFNNTKGKAKQHVAHAAAKPSLAGEGIVDRLKGKIEKGYGEAKEAIKEGVDKIMEKTHSK